MYLILTYAVVILAKNTKEKTFVVFFVEKSVYAFKQSVSKLLVHTTSYKNNCLDKQNDFEKVKCVFNLQKFQNNELNRNDGPHEDLTTFSYSYLLMQMMLIFFSLTLLP